MRNDVLAKDAEFVWHPFTQHAIDASPIVIKKAKGCYLYSENDRYLDAISSWWCNLHGHAHPLIAKSIYKQAKTLEHVIFSGMTHSPAVSLLDQLIPLLPKGICKGFFSDNGSTSVEIAIKMAIQYFQNQRSPRSRIVKLTNSYHGDTFGTMSLSCNLFASPFSSFLFETITLPSPYPGQENLAAETAEKLFNNNKDIAAFIYEPILQGAGGMKIFDAKTFDYILTLAKQNEVICIADEVLTGFGRTGPLFASSLMKEQPDIICLSKGLTGGFLPLALTATTKTIYEGFLSTDRKKAFLHGHTYTANPLGCAAAIESLKLTQSEKCSKQRTFIENSHKKFQKQHGHRWPRCEVLGTLLVLDYPNSSHSYFSELRNHLSNAFLERGLLLRPLGNTIYVLPPYCISSKELNFIYSSLVEVLCQIPQ
ncbi:adenosylmethionine--8-amino-7-oxononanoate transaminase [Chlamydiifrater phoenicopteri]|uniref:adenosylmethionine--8-amino-7-oxononanoate transaminase n=1 Tax=Chlamydiifrater phoenicopteri TaxID=2681469 RepID=UPI001BCEEDA2|nr:adenosylmethionine--8-amino-7-oxononanoate transaminase [Chlamydiifrater phoenicopteri]